MAKLSARGRTEILRFSKETEGDGQDLIKRKTTIAIMSDRNILKKSTTWWKNIYRANGTERKDGGWTVSGKFKKELDLTMAANSFFEKYEKIGYVKE